MKQWLKYEFLELEAIMEAFHTRNAIEKKLMSCITKHREALTESQTLDQGGLTFKTFFLGKESK